jgi:hypothetical protein
LEIRELILKERGNLCEFCGRRSWEDLHHCIVHDNKRIHKQVTVPENLMAVCRTCHPHLNGHEIRVRFALKQIERGYDIIRWYKELPMKIKERWILDLERSLDAEESSKTTRRG